MPAYRREQNSTTEVALRQAFTPDAIGWQYLDGVADESLDSVLSGRSRP